MNTTIRDIIAIIVGLFIFFLLFGSLYTVKLRAPDYATVYVDPEKKIYYAPPYINSLNAQPKPGNPNPVDITKLKAITLKEARALNYSPDQTSQEKGYFVQRYRNLTSYVLEKAGISKPLPLRWNKDGTWNW
ncbi:MAG: hypothetical protein K6T65_03190 [Peptococcaceae bacterium]|nr:hypothetical protein [Peptococcaceae bacterium]